jgi:hypothetical protein
MSRSPSIKGGGEYFQEDFGTLYCVCRHGIAFTIAPSWVRLFQSPVYPF